MSATIVSSGIGLRFTRVQIPLLPVTRCSALSKSLTSLSPVPLSQRQISCCHGNEPACAEGRQGLARNRRSVSGRIIKLSAGKPRAHSKRPVNVNSCGIYSRRWRSRGRTLWAARPAKKGRLQSSRSYRLPPRRAPQHRVSSPLLPARTLPGEWTAGGHSPSLPRASRSLGSDQAVGLAPRPASRGDSSPPGARPRHTFPIPSPAGAPSPVTWAGRPHRALPSELVWNKT